MSNITFPTKLAIWSNVRIGSRFGVNANLCEDEVGWKISDKAYTDCFGKTCLYLSHEPVYVLDEVAHIAKKTRIWDLKAGYKVVQADCYASVHRICKYDGNELDENILGGHVYVLVPASEQVGENKKEVKEKKMSVKDVLVETTATAANQAANMKAAKIATNTLTRAIAKKAPLMVRGYLENEVVKALVSVVGGNVIAALATADKVPVKVSPRAAKLGVAMTTNGLLELFNLIDIGAVIGEMLNAIDEEDGKKE